MYNAKTCLYPEEPATTIFVNDSKNPKKVRPSRKNNKVYDYAPGEKAVPTDWIREKDHDIIAWPELYCDGKGGLNHPDRTVKLTEQ